MTTAAAERACPGCGADLTGAHFKRKWCSERCRKRTTYGGQCRECGATTNGSNGPGAASDLCNRCAPTAHRTWTPERIVEAIQEWARRYGTPPHASDWDPAIARYSCPESGADKQRRYAEGDWPATNTVVYAFGRFNEGILAAGFSPTRPGGV